MPRRTQILSKIPWTGGLNTAVDPGMIPDNDLVRADNVEFGSSGSRLKRQGLEYFDADSAIPSVLSRSSSGTTKTLVFSETVNTATNEKLVVGEKITVASTVGAESTYIGDVTILSITTTTLTDDTITYTGGSLTESDTATSSITVTRNWRAIAIHDYWHLDASSLKVQRLMVMSDEPKLYSYDSDGERTEINADAGFGGFSTAISKASMITFNNRCIVSFDGLNNTPIKFRPEDDPDFEDLGGSPPDCEFMQEHIGRLWSNDKTDRDRLHYTTTADHEEWGGSGDSGAIDIGVGDGDPEGITAIFPAFKGRLFVAKRTKLYQIIGDAPENFRVDLVSNGIGCVGHQAVVPVDQDDIMFMSDRGWHSLAATDSYGDFEGQFLSAKIQPTFNTFQQGTLGKSWGAYIPSINSVAFTAAEDANTDPNSMYLFNTELKEWYRWPNIPAQCMTVQVVNQQRKLVMGTRDGRIIRAQRGTYTDYADSGIRFNVKSGVVYPGNDPISIKAFKKIGFLFKPLGRFSFTVRVRVDNFGTQALVFEQEISGAKLDVDFILGESVLGIDQVLAPYWQQIDGWGRGLSIEIEQTGTEEQVEIYGFVVEWEPGDISQETNTGSDS